MRDDIIITSKPETVGIEPDKEAHVEICFTKDVYEARILDPEAGFEERAVHIEVRTDSFTGSKARVLTHRWRMPQGSEERAVIEKSRQSCPFCPDNLEKMTPKFLPDLIKEGRITHGNAVVVPNAFPYSQHSAVVIMTPEHYVSLNEFESSVLHEAFDAAMVYLRRARAADGGISYASINWNYMPPSGAGMIHPHLQVVAEAKPTLFQERLLTQSLNYHMEKERNYWADLIGHEEQEKARFVGRAGNGAFLTAYAPRGMLGEIIAVFEKARTMEEIGQDGWEGFSKGLTTLLRCFHNMGINSLNMALIGGMDNAGHFWIQARIIPRVSVAPLGVSDVNYFEKGHQEVITVISPEELAQRLREVW